jgi:hypothetical protein
LSKPDPWIKLDYEAIDRGQEPWNGDEVLVYVDFAGTTIVRLAWWDDGSLWEHHNSAGPEEDIGWWTSENSLTSVRLEGHYVPTHWCPAPRPFPKE